MIAIIGIASTVAVPTFNTWRERSAANSATSALLSSLKQARVIAMAENRNVKITFGANSYTYDADPAGTCGLCKPHTVSLSNFSNKLAVTINRTPAETIFYSRGTVNQTSTITVAAGDFRHQISLNIIGRAYEQ